MYRNTYVEINKKNLRDNVTKIIKKYNNYEYYFGVVKANAYGHGFSTVNDLIESGINYLAVSSLDEAVEVRNINKKIPILCLEPIDLIYIEDVIKYNITLTVESLSYVKELSKLKLKKILKVHFKLDTGMSRLGFYEHEDFIEAFNILSNNKNIEIEGIYSHLATTGINDVYYDRQVNKFEEFLKDVDLSKVSIIHFGSSKTLVHNKKLDVCNGVRLGIIMYGFNNSVKEPTGIRKLKRNMILKSFNISETYLENDLDLQTAFTLYTKVMSIRKIKTGSFVSYGANYIADEDTYVATIPIGYYDGMKKELKYVVINNKKYEIIGDICMDMTLVKVDESVKVDDLVEVFGDKITIKEVANNLNTNAYHVLTGITNRVERRYKD